MYLTDPIADMLTRIRNASQAGLKYAVIPASRLKIDVTKVLESEGYIRGFRLLRDGKQGKIKVAIKYLESGDPIIQGIKRASRPGRRFYMSADSLKRRHVLGIAIVSTSKGVLCDTDACSKSIGGEVLAYVW